MPKVRSYSKYKKEHIKLVDTYLAEKQKNNDKWRLARIKRVELPGIQDFALYIGVSKKTIYNWEKEKPAFAKKLDKIRMVAFQMLINEGLAGNYSPVIAKLILYNNYGMREGADVHTDEKPLNNFTDEQVNRIADRVAGRKREASVTPSEK